MDAVKIGSKYARKKIALFSKEISKRGINKLVKLLN